MPKAVQFVTEIGKARNPKFMIDDDNRFVYEQLIKWMMGDEDFQCHQIDNPDHQNLSVIQGDLKKGIYLCGPTGTGKSWVLELINLLSDVDNIPVVIAGEQKRFKFKTIRTDDICREYSSTGDIYKYKQLPLLCLHDLCSDSEPETSLYMGNRLKVMQSILESRGDQQNLITLFSSNVPFNHPLFRERYSDRVVSRMYEMCNYFELRGKDRRKG
jgi:hypothetical protein